MVEDTRRRGHNHTNLPSDIWQIIARYLRPQGWATVAGTCKTTWELQLDTVHIRQVARTLLSNEKPLCGAGVAWVLKRAKRAQQLLLDLPRESADLQATVEALMQVTGGFSRLNALSLRAWQYSDEDLPSLIMAVSLLVGQSKGLVFLSLDVMSMPLVPSLSHIWHLQMAISYDNLPKMAHAIAKLFTLQTLCLDGSKMEEDEAIGKQANLDLQALAHLKGVTLDGLVLTSLRLPKGTALHAVAYSLAEAGDIFWTSVVGALIPDTFVRSALCKLRSCLSGMQGCTQ